MCPRRYTVYVSLFFMIAGAACSRLPAIIPSVPADPPGMPGGVSRLEARIYEQINQHRASIGMPRLTLDPVLTSLAREHSSNMAAGRVPVGHDGFEERFEAARRSIRISRISENVASNRNYVEPAVPFQMVDGWINSPSHRANLEGAFVLTGVGVVRNSQGEYFGTQIFASR